jgi:uncharacterized protein YjbI with pentapeptide repeats
MITIRRRNDGTPLLHAPADTLVGARLAHAELPYADLHGTTLDGADPRAVNLCIAALAGASLDGGRRTAADVSGATLTGADLTGAILRDADLRHADLVLANLNGVSLRGARLDDSSLGRTVLADCADLHLANGLADIRQLEPSSIDVRTLRRVLRYISGESLERLGVAPEELRALRVD